MGEVAPSLHVPTGWGGHHLWAARTACPITPLYHTFNYGKLFISIYDFVLIDTLGDCADGEAVVFGGGANRLKLLQCVNFNYALFHSVSPDIVFSTQPSLLPLKRQPGLQASLVQ